MKRVFDNAEIELIVFATSDIITTSGNDVSFPGDDDVIEY